MPATSITEVRTVGVNVTDQDTALRFYIETLGFETRLDAHISPTTRWIEVAPHGAATSIALIPTDGDTEPHNTGIRFVVPDADAEHQTMQQRGVTVSDILRWDNIPPMYTFDDLDGNRFYIVEQP